ncbi:MAG: fatty acid desaturase [Candidatus Latescibacteria bacterium]|jgi:fatty acid desaturase|nr:fatty acid desaturase [Candidatus Latescibacterota bacterium]
MNKSGKIKASDFVPQTRLGELLAKKDGPGILYLLGHLSVLAITGFLLHLSLDTGWIIPAVVLHGTVIVHLFAPFHEANHYTAFSSQWLNKSVAWFTGLSIFLIPLYFRYEHIAHHNHTQMQKEDPEMIPMAERLTGYLYYTTAIPYFYSNLLTLARVPFRLYNSMELKFIPNRELDHVWRQACIMCMVYIGLAALSVALETWMLVVYWLIPRFAGEPIMRLIRMTEHTGCPRVADILRNTRTVLTFAPVRWLGWNNAYHAEHHAVPTVPFHALGELHQTMGSQFAEIRKGYLHTQIHLIKNSALSDDKKNLENEAVIAQ